jgi:hypothetical protein
VNHLDLIYKELPLGDIECKFEITTQSKIYTTTRQQIKSKFSGWTLKPNNLKGRGVSIFNRHVGRFKHAWLDFEIQNFSAEQSDYPSEQEIVDLCLVQETEISSAEGWRESIREEVSGGRVFLLVGLNVCLEQSSFRRSMLSNGLPSRCCPCEFEIFDFVVTNAPICQFIRYKAHVLV